MFWNLFVRPKFRISDKIDVCVTAFEAEDEEFVRTLFYKHHLGLDIITTSQHVTRELAYKQIYDMGDAIGSHFEFHEPSMMCHECKINPTDHSFISAYDTGRSFIASISNSTIAQLHRYVQ